MRAPVSAGNRRLQGSETRGRLCAEKAGETTRVADNLTESFNMGFRRKETAFIQSMFRRLLRNSISFT